MIPHLVDEVSRFATGPFLLVFVCAAVLTAGVLLAQSLAGWFDDRDS